MKRATDLKWSAKLHSQVAVALIVSVLLAGLAFCLAPSWDAHGQIAGQDEVKLREHRGKQIYLQGTSASGKEILAYLGESSLEVTGQCNALRKLSWTQRRGQA